MFGVNIVCYSQELKKTQEKIKDLSTAVAKVEQAARKSGIPENATDQSLVAVKKEIKKLEHQEYEFKNKIEANPSRAQLQEKGIALQDKITKSLTNAHDIIMSLSIEELKEYCDSKNKINIYRIRYLKKEVNKQIFNLRCENCGMCLVGGCLLCACLIILAAICPRGNLSLGNLGVGDPTSDARVVALENIKEALNNAESAWLQLIAVEKELSENELKETGADSEKKEAKEFELKETKNEPGVVRKRL